MAEDGYPDDDELKRIEGWPHTDIPGLLNYVRELWHWPNGAWIEGDKHCFATGGWSGNESLIAALKNNFMFLAACWQLSKRGGYFEFEVPECFRLSATSFRHQEGDRHPPAHKGEGS